MFQNAVMNLTTLRIGGRATFSCEHGYKLLGDADISCLTSGSWSGWPPGCVEVDCGQPLTVENARHGDIACRKPGVVSRAISIK